MNVIDDFNYYTVAENADEVLEISEYETVSAWLDDYGWL